MPFSWLQRKWRGWSASDEAEYAEAKHSTSALLDEALALYRKGLEPSEDGLGALGNAFATLYATLSRRSGTEDSTEFDEDDRTCFYAEALKLAALFHPQHDAWPARSKIRSLVLKRLLARLGKEEDPWLRLCAVTSALAVGAPQVALDAYSKIGDDPFLSGLARRWAHHALISYPSHNPHSTYETFLAEIVHDNPWEVSTETRPSHHWVLLASIYPDVACDPRTTLHDTRPRASQRLQLRRDWDIVDRESAMGTLDWLANEGHRAQFVADITAPDHAHSPARAAFIAANRHALRRDGILAWDLGRLVGVARSAYAVGYIDRHEIDDILESVGRSLRDRYPSWSEFGDDYVLGRRYVSPADALTCPHIAIVRWLAQAPQSPWHRVRFGGGSGPPS